MPEQPPRALPARARAIADLGLAALIERREELTSSWLAALVLARPLEDLGGLQLGELAARGPSLIEGTLRALGSEEALQALLGGPPAPELGDLRELAGARDAATLVDALEALRGVLWEALLAALATGETGAGAQRLTAEAADRLAHVCAALLSGALVGGAAESPERAESSPAPTASELRRGVVIHDEHLPVAEGAPAPIRGRLEQPPVEISIHDARREPFASAAEGPAAWIGAIGARLERFELDGLPFAVLLMEIETRRRGGHQELWPELERALADELDASAEATLTRERPGRYWLLLARADRIGADALAVRLERAVAGAAARRGAIVSVVCGLALCPDDATQAPALAAHADVGLYAARWEARLAAPRGEGA